MKMGLMKLLYMKNNYRNVMFLFENKWDRNLMYRLKYKYFLNRYGY